MRTADLIDAIAADAKSPPKRLEPAMLAALVLSVLAAGLAFSMLLGPRADLDAAVGTSRFALKFAVTGAFGLAGATLAMRLARPGADPRPALALFVFAATLVAGSVAAELVAVPSREWGARLFGRNWRLCLMLIPLLSAAPLALILAAMRRGAPGSPAWLGAAAGVLAGAVGASFYAFHCVDDSPLFVGAWYLVAIGLVALAGAAIGSRVLRW